MIPHIHNSPILKCDNTRYHKQIRLIIINILMAFWQCNSVTIFNLQLIMISFAWLHRQINIACVDYFLNMVYNKI